MVDLVALICRLTGYQGEVVWDASMPDGQPRRKVHAGRARALFEFQPRVEFEEGLRRTIEWFEAQH
jgi:GDP-L-fucose synthase